VGLVEDCASRADIRYIDIGGGLGITYNDETPPLPLEFAQALIDVIRDLGATVILEPGRVLVGNAGILVTRVLYTKQSPVKNFVVVDAGMNDLARPSLYGSYHAPGGASRLRAGRGHGERGRPDLRVGDFLAKDRKLPRFEPGELMAVMSAGATGTLCLRTTMRGLGSRGHGAATSIYVRRPGARAHPT
jgi:diaminopimelate decarboxylase